jgi:hypothetical protein
MLRVAMQRFSQYYAYYAEFFGMIGRHSKNSQAYHECLKVLVLDL